MPKIPSSCRHITAQFRWQVGRGQNVIDPLYCFIFPFNCSLAFGWLDDALEEGIKTARVTLVLSTRSLSYRGNGFGRKGVISVAAAFCC